MVLWASQESRPTSSQEYRARIGETYQLGACHYRAGRSSRYDAFDLYSDPKTVEGDTLLIMVSINEGEPSMPEQRVLCTYCRT